MIDPDRPALEITEDIANMQSVLDRSAAIMAYYLSSLKQWGIERPLLDDLMRDFHSWWFGLDPE